MESTLPIIGSRITAIANALWNINSIVIRSAYAKCRLIEISDREWGLQIEKSTWLEDEGNWII